ncbi:unnamed protein product [Pylaiella littoralis]
MLQLIVENKIASIGAAAMATGVVLLLSAATVDTGPTDDDEGGTQVSRTNKKRTLLAVGGSMMSVGVLASVYDQYTRRMSPGTISSSSLLRPSSQMSPRELRDFQDRVSTAAAKLRRSLAETDRATKGGRGDGVLGGRKESAAELAARASAQISSFIRNYS